MNLNHLLQLCTYLLLAAAAMGCANASQESSPQKLDSQANYRTMKPSTDLPAGTKLVVAFYNVENLFDTQDQPKKIDEDFLPDGKYNWTEEKLEIKLQNLAKAIGKMGENGPDFIGLAEVENRALVERLANHPLIRNKGYKVVHDESPDARGIDVAFLYDPEKMNYQGYEALEVKKPGNPDFKTREILMVKGKINGLQTYFFVNHWPSRREGQQASEPNRVAAASRAKDKMESILKENPDAAFVLMGDFNDDPIDKSITQVLGATGDKSELTEDQLFNPMNQLYDPNQLGSLTYQGKWNLFDQIMVSEDLMDGNHALSYLPGSAKVFNEEMVRVPNRKTKFVPRRAIFRGEFQSNGFSDHFPVYLKLYVN